MKQRFLRAECLEPRAMLSASLPTGPVLDAAQATDPPMVEEAFTPTSAPQVMTLPGDFNADNVVNSIDIDMLTANLGDHLKSEFDLTTDGFVDKQDMDMLIRDIIGTEYGDADLDGYVGPMDGVTMLRSMFSGATGWAAGDFSCDGVIDGQDFIEWNRFKFTETRLHQSLTGQTPDNQYSDMATDSKQELQPIAPASSFAASPSQDLNDDHREQGDKAAENLEVAGQNVTNDSTRVEQSVRHESSNVATPAALPARTTNGLAIQHPEARFHRSFRLMRSWS